MQIKIIITVGLLIGMVTIFSYFALAEPDRMHLAAQDSTAKQIEQGAIIYQQHCSSCHGGDGKAELCYDGEGDQIACRGFALNRYEFLCKENGKSLRMVALGWEGTQQAFIEATITTGRPWNDMPAWGADYGGPLDQRDIENVTAFLLNFQSPNSGTGFLSTPPTEWPISPQSLPVGNAVNGEELFHVTYSCAACHGDPEIKDSNPTGPWAGQFKSTTLRRGDIEYTPADYFYESVLLPNAYIALNCPSGKCSGPPSNMPDNFGLRLGENLQDMADMMAYVGIDSLDTSGVEIQYPPRRNGPTSIAFSSCDY